MGWFSPLLTSSLVVLSLGQDVDLVVRAPGDLPCKTVKWNTCQFPFQWEYLPWETRWPSSPCSGTRVKHSTVAPSTDPPTELPGAKPLRGSTKTANLIARHNTRLSAGDQFCILGDPDLVVNVEFNVYQGPPRKFPPSWRQVVERLQLVQLPAGQIFPLVGIMLRTEEEWKQCYIWS